MLTCRVVGFSVVIGVAGLAGAVGQAPVLVSPGTDAGSPAAEAMVEARCPTFSWALQGPADALEVRVVHLGAADFPVQDPAELLAAPAVVAARVPGTASSWTPALPHCLEAGRSYLWTVGALGPGSPEMEPAQPHRFRVAVVPAQTVGPLLQTVDRLLLEGVLEGAAADALLRALDL